MTITLATKHSGSKLALTGSMRRCFRSRSNSGMMHKGNLFAQGTPQLTVLRDISSPPGGAISRVLNRDGSRMDEPGKNIHVAGVLTL